MNKIRQKSKISNFTFWKIFEVFIWSFYNDKIINTERIYPESLLKIIIYRQRKLLAPKFSDVVINELAQTRINLTFK